ncbi:hypothetical protein [Motiliproteus sp. SC1-56]|uniref:hypothetical protein n=1 Tax=Motiliproteus sp. SC1-56 TaxID=2799565 RepID=UPI001A8E3C4C|nr:hypothetical protein [Motiliproteus sp. SC1-56]
MLPKNFYELLPFIYSLVGMLSLLLVETPLALIFSLMLIMAGLVLVAMRFYHRHRS